MTNLNFLWNKLLEAVLLLVGLVILDTAIVMAAPVIVGRYFSTNEHLVWGEYLVQFIQYSHWIGQIMFGLFIYYKIRHIRIAAPIGLLSTLIPVFGVLFYLMTSTITQTNNDR